MYFWSLLLIYTLIEITMACPPNCVCKWKGGKQTVECVNKSLLMVPGGIDSGTQVLDFAGNNLMSLGGEQFQRLGLINLQKIFLPRCRLDHINDHAFKGLSNLIELDISNNNLTHVPELIFNDLPSLMRLNLNHNPLRRIRGSTFKNLKYLVSLELIRCQLETIEEDAFYGLQALELLKLDDNQLKYIAGANTIPKRLHGISLQKNPWWCDCKLADLYSWLNTSNVSQAVEPLCEGPPRLKHAPIKLLDDQELACQPDISPTSLYLEIAEGKNVSLLCRVTATPAAKVTWRFEDRVLHNDTTVAPGLHLYYFFEEGTVEKRSELFIFNANVEDNGTFICVAENQAGRAESNYTIRIVLKDEPQPPVKKIPFEYMAAVCAAGAVVLVLLAVSCAVACALRYRVRRRQRRKKAKSKELALYGNGDGAASPITRSGETLSTISDACIQKSNGSIFIADQSILKMSPSDLSNAACASRAFYSNACNLFTPEQNPDLINDTSIDRKPTTSAAEPATRSSNACSRSCSTVTTAQSALNVDKMVYSTMAPCHDWLTPTSAVVTSQAPAANLINVPVNVCFNHFQARDLHLTPDKFIVDADAYPTNYGLPKLTTHFPPLLPATAFYRTLPHRRHQAAAAGAATPCNSRFAREAELLTRSAQPASYEHFLNGDIRYNVEGYPKDSPASTYTPHVSFSDTVQILGKSSDGSNDSNGAAPSTTGLTGATTSTSTTTRPEGKREHRISISLVNTTMAQRPFDDMPAVGGVSGKKASLMVGEANNPDLAKLSKTPRLSVCMKNMTDSPDEGYVGEGPDTTEV